jgi:hypothetical protein
MEIRPQPPKGDNIMMPFFRCATLRAPVNSARYGLAVALAILFSLITFQAPVPFSDTTLNPTSWRFQIPGTAQADVVADFNEKFDALIPPANSSVHSDYLFEQIALGSRYTIIQLEQIREQSAANSQRFEKLSEQLNTLIEQNQQIIELLEKQKDL